MRIAEIFLSIQGESSRAGWPTVFVRCAGCNLDCRYCDTRYAREGGTVLAADEVAARVRAFGVGRVTVTGGEPLLQDEVPGLCRRLIEAGADVQVETNGSRDISVLPRGARAILDVKTPGSGMEHCNDYANLGRLRPGDEVKFVLTDRDDYVWAREAVTRRSLEQHTVLFAPAAGRLAPGTLADWLLADRCAGIRLQVQLHLYLWPPGQAR